MIIISHYARSLLKGAITITTTTTNKQTKAKVIEDHLLVLAALRMWLALNNRKTTKLFSTEYLKYTVFATEAL